MTTELREDEERLQAIIDTNMDAVVRMDGAGMVIDWGGSALKIFGYSKEEVLWRKLSELIVPEQYREAHDKGVTNYHNIDWTKPPFHVHGQIIESLAVRKDGTEFPIEISIFYHPRKGKGKEKGENEFCWFIRDITERKAAAQKILEMATYDSLTGLPNRRLLSDRLEQAINSSERSGEFCAVLFIDLDRFKPVNDTYGHEVGDILLKKVAERLETITRSMDTAARIWGDEFVVVAPWLKHESDVSWIAEKIISTLSLPFHIQKHEVFIGASVGIWLFPRDGKTAEELLKYSDVAMYKAKSSGRGIVCDFNIDK